MTIMYDVVELALSPEMIRYIVVWTLTLSALMVFVLAFVVTRGAGFHCPLALLRGAQRLFLCTLAISLAYVCAYIAYYAVDTVPLGPLLLLFINFMVATLLSGIRHVMAPAIAADNTWTGAWRLLRGRTQKVLIEHGLAHTVGRAR